MWLMMQQEAGDDYVLATGETTLVRDFVAHAFAQVGLELAWSGVGVEESGACTRTGRVYVEVDPCYFRPTEVELLIGDPTKARDKLGWVHETKWQALCEEDGAGRPDYRRPGAAPQCRLTPLRMRLR